MDAESLPGFEMAPPSMPAASEGSSALAPMPPPSAAASSGTAKELAESAPRPSVASDPAVPSGDTPATPQALRDTSQPSNVAFPSVPSDLTLSQEDIPLQNWTGFGPNFGPYLLVEEIARGGMGIVYRARHKTLGRDVALKMIRGGSLATDKEVERFYREAQAVAQLKHPNVVQVFDFGKLHDQHYFTMGLATRGSLAKQMARFRTDPRKAVELMEKVALAVHHIHEKGLLHRDLKPSNILLDDGDVPIVSDFGLAKVLESDIELTTTGEAPGTPAYMAPEQAAGLSDQLSPRTDIWALGVLLYELVCGARPFLGKGRPAITRAILHLDPPRPSDFQPGFDRDLETILLKCLEKDPARRYASAADLAADLAAWRRGEPITARRHSRLGLLLRRHKKTVAALAGLAVIAAAVGVLLYLRAPYRQVEEIQARILRGMPVELIGRTGKPAWFHWVHGEGDAMVAQTADELFRINCPSAAFLELLPDPMTEHFILRAEVKQAPGFEFLQSGLYVLRRTTDNGHCCAIVSFSEAGEFKGRVETELIYAPFWKPGIGIKERMQTPLQRNFDPHPETWRRLAVAVRPEGLSMSWDGVEASSMDRDELHKRAAAMIMVDAPRNQRQSLFSPRGGIGLYVQGGTTAFRNVRIEPLNP